MNNDGGLLSALADEQWAMEQRALDALFAQVRAVEGRAPVAQLFAAAPLPESRMKVDGAGVATIPVTGVLLRAVPMWARLWGIDATGYEDIREDLARALADDGVREIRLAVDSPGGTVDGLKEAADAIFAARAAGKPVRADVEGMMASAAYWLGSQASEITAGPNDRVGSIGVYVALADFSKLYYDLGIKVHLVASGPHKGTGLRGVPITEEQLSPIQAVVDGMADNFVDDVVRGRGRSRSQIKAAATGQVWLGAEALRMGLVDRLRSGSRETTAAARATAQDPPKLANSKERPMSDQNQAPRQPASIADLKAAFAGESDFVLEQAAAGATLLEAKAAFGEVLKARAAEDRERAAAVEKENAELKRKLDAAANRRPGDPGVPAQRDPGAASEQGYLERAKELARERGWTLTQAYRHIAQNEPELYQGYLPERVVAERQKRNQELGIRR